MGLCRYDAVEDHYCPKLKGDACDGEMGPVERKFAENYAGVGLNLNLKHYKRVSR